jgi:transposase-like protein
MVKPDCPRCQSSALVRKETVVTASDTVESFYCGRCDHSWATEGDRRAVPREDADRPDRSRTTRRGLR